MYSYIQQSEKELLRKYFKKNNFAHLNYFQYSLYIYKNNIKIKR